MAPSGGKSPNLVGLTPEQISDVMASGRGEEQLRQQGVANIVNAIFKGQDLRTAARTATVAERGATTAETKETRLKAGQESEIKVREARAGYLDAYSEYLRGGGKGPAPKTPPYDADVRFQAGLDAVLRPDLDAAALDDPNSEQLNALSKTLNASGRRLIRTGIPEAIDPSYWGLGINKKARDIYMIAEEGEDIESPEFQGRILDRLKSFYGYDDSEIEYLKETYYD